MMHSLFNEGIGAWSANVDEIGNLVGGREDEANVATHTPCLCIVHVCVCFQGKRLVSILRSVFLCNYPRSSLHQA